MTIHLRISSGIQLSHQHPFPFSPFLKFVHVFISNHIWDTSKLLLEGFNKIRHLRVLMLTVTRNVINKTRHAKTCGRTITCKCPQHGSGITKIIILLPPVYELPSRPSAAGKLCSVCTNPIRSRYAALAYHCEDPSCDVCHLSATQPVTSPARPNPPSLNSLLNQGMSLTDAKNSKEKCAKCFAAL